MAHTNGFQGEATSPRQPPFFAKGSVSDSGLTVEIIDEDGHRHTFHVDEALALIEARRYAMRFGAMEVNTDEFTSAAPEADCEILL